MRRALLLTALAAALSACEVWALPPDAPDLAEAADLAPLCPSHPPGCTICPPELTCRWGFLGWFCDFCGDGGAQ